MSTNAELLADGVRRALDTGLPTKVAVHSEIQANLGQKAARRMGGDRADLVTFVVIPEDEQEQYPVGAILVS